MTSASMLSSPLAAAQARRRSYYKSAAPRPPQISPRTPDSPAKAFFSRTTNHTPDNPQKAFLRQRLQARCRESAQRQREKAISSRRSSDFSDDIMDDEEDESDDIVMQDELFRRIMQGANHKKTHAYRVSYSLEVGSSFDPDMEDATTWESELQSRPRTDQTATTGSEDPPDEREEEELLAYAEQCALLEDLEDIDVTADDFSTWSDVEDMPLGFSQESSKGKYTQDHDMDVS